VALFLPQPTWEEFAGFTPTLERPEAVVMGDLGDAWTFDRLNQAFRLVLDGAQLVALQKNRFWKVEQGLVLDAGPFVAAIEFATGVTAQVIGKPAAEFFRAAARALGLSVAELVMVGDDAEADVLGAQEAGCLGVLVRTGKYRPGDETRSVRAPDAVLGSVAELPEWLTARPRR
jgi:HAD superfamily hydrolase (TIGR01458 family)